jgi:thioredoxin 1
MKTKTAIYFTADWCPSCKKTKPVVEEINRDIFPGIFQLVDVDTEIEMAQTFEIRSIPTFVLLENGCEIGRVSGNQTRQSLMDFINNE